jgi:hypothetical protein
VCLCLYVYLGISKTSWFLAFVMTCSVQCNGMYTITLMYHSLQIRFQYMCTRIYKLDLRNFIIHDVSVVVVQCTGSWCLVWCSWIVRLLRCYYSMVLQYVSCTTGSVVYQKRNNTMVAATMLARAAGLNTVLKAIITHQAAQTQAQSHMILRLVL